MYFLFRVCLLPVFYAGALMGTRSTIYIQLFSVTALQIHAHIQEYIWSTDTLPLGDSDLSIDFDNIDVKICFKQLQNDSSTFYTRVN